MEKDLTFKQKLFVKHYMTNGYNATQAYMSVYPDSSYHAAQTSSSDLLLNPVIKQYLEQEEKIIHDALLITKEKVILDLMDIIKSSKDDPKQKHNANKAIDTLNKMLGFNESKGINVTFDSKSISDLLNFNDDE